MSDQPPPHYDDTHSEQAPAYNSTSDISSRWHIINTPAKGIFGSRGISFVSDQSATADTTNLPAPTQPMDGLGYDLIFVDSAQMEVHPRAPPKSRSGSSSGDIWKTPVVAKVQLSTTNPAQATVIFNGDREAKITVDAQDLRPDPFQPQSTKTNGPTYITMYHMTPKADILPVCWSAETNKEFTDSDTKNFRNEVDSNPIKTDSHKKPSWKDKLKETMGPKPPSAEEQRIKDDKLKYQKQSLCSNFTLQDSRGTIYARFSNEFFKDASTFTKMPTYEKTAKQLKSWGHVDLNSSYYTALRSKYPMFEKWSDTDLELVVLCSLMAVLEVNVKLNGGAGPGAAFSSYYSVTSGGDPRTEGMPAVVGAGLRAVGQSMWFATSS